MQLPARIGKYELVELLGGGMAQVYRAQDTLLGRTVALKILSEHGVNDAETKARFLQEAKMAGSIVHENIIAIYDYGHEQNRPYIVMEFIRGQSLKDAIKQHKTGDINNKLWIALQVARALEYIHARKIIHRDIKPDNIQIEQSGKVKLVDFGIAKAQGVSLTRVGFTLGTPYYMAPEQILGLPATPLVDIYAFGILVYELLTGSKPITGSSVDDIFRQVLHEPLNLDPLEQTDAPPQVIDLVRRCTHKEAAQRLQSFNAICTELEQILDPGGSPATQTMPIQSMQAADDESLPGFLDKLPPAYRTQNWLITLAAVGVLVVMALLYGIIKLISSLL